MSKMSKIRKNVKDRTCRFCKKILCTKQYVNKHELVCKLNPTREGSGSGSGSSSGKSNDSKSQTRTRNRNKKKNKSNARGRGYNHELYLTDSDTDDDLTSIHLDIKPKSMKHRPTSNIPKDKPKKYRRPECHKLFDNIKKNRVVPKENLTKIIEELDEGLHRDENVPYFLTPFQYHLKTQLKIHIGQCVQLQRRFNSDVIKEYDSDLEDSSDDDSQEEMVDEDELVCVYIGPYGCPKERFTREDLLSDKYLIPYNKIPPEVFSTRLVKEIQYVYEQGVLGRYVSDVAMRILKDFGVLPFRSLSPNPDEILYKPNSMSNYRPDPRYQFRTYPYFEDSEGEWYSTSESESESDSEPEEELEVETECDDGCNHHHNNHH